jgi:hypothetical protein
VVVTTGGPGHPQRQRTRLLVGVTTVCLSLALALGAALTPSSVAAASARVIRVLRVLRAETAAPPLGAVVIPALGPGYSISSQGPLNPSQFASDSPDPSAAAGALATLGNSISTYERMWQANRGLNQVQDLLVRFPSPGGAQVFLRAAQQSLDSGEIVSKGTMASIPGARLVTYFAATNQSGVGEAITMRLGSYVALLSFFSAAAGNTQPIAPADAERVALAQHTALVSAAGGASSSAPAAHGGAHPSAALGSASTSVKRSTTSSDIGWAVLAVVIVALAVTTPLLLRRRRERTVAPGA